MMNEKSLEHANMKNIILIFDRHGLIKAPL